MMHGYYSHAQFHSSYQMHAIETVDQGEELLERLEQSGRVPSKDKFRRMACMVNILSTFIFYICALHTLLHRRSSALEFAHTVTDVRPPSCSKY